uniref:Predicted protein n=1 Tax=Hordeum vulgare subsp. vulgare TaxID=112509 RepID=F2E837_HORVV|nr:predicted protein [Hordeum vulgare subsp. vulgare]
MPSPPEQDAAPIARSIDAMPGWPAQQPIEHRTTGPAARSPAHTATQNSRTGGFPKGPASRRATRHGGGAGPEEQGAGESVGQELGGALHHGRRLGKDEVPHGAGGDGGMEVEIGSRRPGRVGRCFFLSSVPVWG